MTTNIEPSFWWSIEQIATWIETRDEKATASATFRGFRQEALSEMTQAWLAGNKKAWSSIDTGRLVEIQPAEWTEYVLEPRWLIVAGLSQASNRGNCFITVRSIRSFPASALAGDYSEPSGVLVPSADGGREPGFYRVLKNVVMKRTEVIAEWPTPDTPARKARLTLRQERDERLAEILAKISPNGMNLAESQGTFTLKQIVSLLEKEQDSLFPGKRSEAQTKELSRYYRHRKSLGPMDKLDN